jgi:nitronate monooxygenase
MEISDQAVADARRRDFRALFNIRHPIVQGPMNGASPPELVIAVSRAGALGSLAAALLTPEQILQTSAQIRRAMDCPFAVNLFVLPSPIPEKWDLEAALDRLETAHNRFGLPRGSMPTRFCENFEQQLEALLEAAPPVVSFTFGIISADAIERFHRKKVRVIGTATTVAEAVAWESRGADAVCIQGIEAGGHRATFLGDFEQAGIGLMALLPQVRRAVAVPIIAAGGMADGRGIAASLLLGADAAQLGTAFLVTPEAGIAPPWLDAVFSAQSDSTRITRSFSGRYARGIVNAYMEQMRPFEATFPPYPLQNALTARLRRSAVEAGNADYMSLWAGQAAPLVRAMRADVLVDTLVQELDAWRAGHRSG